MTEQPATSGPAPAFYARRGGAVSDWWTVLHPPYTLWHLSYVVVGATLAPTLQWVNLAATVLAFFLAVGVAAHALDELHGHPLRTGIGDRTLATVSGVALAAAAALGVVGTWRLGSPLLLVLVAVGVVLVLGYNLELFDGRLHTDLGFALSWGGFPVLVGLVGQDPAADLALVATGAAATAAAVALAYAQRRLSTPARTLRRRTSRMRGVLVLRDGTERELDEQVLLAPLEGALRALCVAMPLLALALVLLRVQT